MKPIIYYYDIQVSNKQQQREPEKMTMDIISLANTHFTSQFSWQWAEWVKWPWHHEDRYLHSNCFQCHRNSRRKWTGVWISKGCNAVRSMIINTLRRSRRSRRRIDGRMHCFCASTLALNHPRASCKRFTSPQISLSTYIKLICADSQDLICFI